MTEPVECMMPIELAGKTHELRVVIESRSDQVMMIRVHGQRSSLLFECNYPAATARGHHDHIQFIVREGSIRMPDGRERIRFEKQLLGSLKKLLKAHFPPEGENTVPGTG
jgi:hypothetical protein